MSYRDLGGWGGAAVTELRLVGIKFLPADTFRGAILEAFFAKSLFI